MVLLKITFFIGIIICLLFLNVDVSSLKPDKEITVFVYDEDNSKRHILRYGSTIADLKLDYEIYEQDYADGYVLSDGEVIKLKLKEKAKVSINSATLEELCEIPGIGAKMAQRIIEYRKLSGGFEKLEDIMNIRGIKEAKYEAIKDYISL